MNAGCSTTVTGCRLSNETDELVNSCLWDTAAANITSGNLAFLLSWSLLDVTVDFVNKMLLSQCCQSSKDVPYVEITDLISGQIQTLSHHICNMFFHDTVTKALKCNTFSMIMMITITAISLTDMFNKESKL